MQPHRDQHSYAEPDKVRIGDIALDLALDFDARQLAGTATYALEWLDPQTTELVLDTRELMIESVDAESGDGKWRPLQFSLADPDELLGSKLTINVPGREQKVRVAYRTAPTASGLQWLTPAMTDGGRTPTCSASRSRSTPVRGCRCRTPRGCASPTARMSARRRT